MIPFNTNVYAKIVKYKKREDGIYEKQLDEKALYDAGHISLYFIAGMSDC